MGETIYRDAEGKKQSADATQEDSKVLQAERERQKQQQLFALNQGKKQQEEQMNAARERERLQNSSFARRADDDDLEVLRKRALRDGDPMAAYQSSSSSTGAAAAARNPHQKPIYKGPPAPPNRFGIKPGYRWDGNHRGNGFENRLLAHKFGQERKKEQAYKWSTSDM